MNIKSIFLVSLTSFLMICIGLSGQTKENQSKKPVKDSIKAEKVFYSNLGIYGSFNMNHHSADLRHLTGIQSNIGRYAVGDNNGFSLGAFYEFLIGYKFWLMLRGLYSNNNPELSIDDVIPAIINNTETQIPVHEKLSAGLSTVVLEPLVKLNLIGGFYFLGGLNAGLRLSNDFKQIQTISPSSPLLFDNGTNTREVTNVISSNPKYSAAICGGISYDIPINSARGINTSIEILYSYGFSEIMEGFVWDVNTIRAGLSVKFAPNKPYVPEKTPEIIPVVAPPQPPMPEPPIVEIPVVIKKAEPEKSEVAITVFGGNENKTEPLKNLVVEEFLSTNIQPVLNYIFFNDGSAVLPERYKQLNQIETNSFFLENLYYLETLPTYYNVLNIFGRRMRDNPNAKITLTGCNSGTGNEKDNSELSKNRAGSVFNYLKDVWQINSDRMILKNKNLPDKPSNSTDEEGITENRRVEITSSNPAILQPVVTYDTVRIAKPRVINFKLTRTGINPNLKWTFDISQKGVVLNSIGGRDTLPNVIEWKLNENKQRLPKFDDELSYKFVVYDSTGANISTTTGKIKVNQIRIKEKKLNKTGDRRIDSYSLILFDFDNASLNESNKKLLEFVFDRIETNSEINVEGYTDRIGEEEHNLLLSQQRAAAAAKVLKAYTSGKNLITDKGFGETIPLYDNTLPEGRFYCRTVKIIVETPDKK